MEMIEIVIVIMVSVVIGLQGIVLGELAKQMANIAWQIERIYRVLDITRHELYEFIEDKNKNAR